MVEVCLPGTGGMLPLANRWLTCCWMEYMGRAILIDCGEGTQIALRAAGCKVSRLHMLLITHYHADHIAGLPGLLLTLGNCGKTSPLAMIGPAGLRRVVEALTVIAPALPYPIELYELADDEQSAITAGDIRIYTLPLAHSMPCLGYRAAFHRKPVFNPEQAIALGVPREMFHTLHSGTPVVLPDGRIIEPGMVLGNPRPPVQVCYCTDTRPTEQLADFACGVDLLISEGMHGDESLRTKMGEKGHMMLSDSAHLAREANARKLWLTHYSPALSDPSTYLDLVRNIFPESEMAYDGIRTVLGKKERGII